MSYVCFSFFFFFKQKTAYEIRKGDWSSDVCSSDLQLGGDRFGRHARPVLDPPQAFFLDRSEERRVGKECPSLCRSRWWPYHSKKKKQIKTVMGVAGRSIYVRSI